jgi:hypothetical protein
MSDAEVVTPSPAACTIPDRAEAIRGLAAENVASVARLRSTQIPQHVGMAAACRQLAVELPGMLVAQVESDLRTGVLAKRWEEICAAAAEDATREGVAPTVAAITVLLREQTRAVMRHLAHRGKEWTADAYRLEGQATALESQAERLRHLAGVAPRSDAHTAGGDASDNAEAVG